MTMSMQRAKTATSFVLENARAPRKIQRFGNVGGVGPAVGGWLLLAMSAASRKAELESVTIYMYLSSYNLMKC